MRSCLWNGCLQLFDPAFFRSLSGKSIYLWKLCGSPCLCGGIAKENAHHRGTEIAQRTTETNSPTDSEAGGSIKPGVSAPGRGKIKRSSLRSRRQLVICSNRSRTVAASRVSDFP